jgi:Stress responsive A/B Barrel Domain
MEFADQAAYDTYNDHPIHVAFVRDRWKMEVSDFMEIDYVKI